jgi:hypothetical protein
MYCAGDYRENQMNNYNENRDYMELLRSRRREVDGMYERNNYIENDVAL